MFWVLRNLVYCRYTRCIREFAFGVSTPVELLQPFESGCIVGLQEAGWTYRWIAAHVGHTVSVVCRCFQQWSVEHSHTPRPGSGWPHGTDARQDRHIVWAAMAAQTAAVSRRTIGNHLLAAGFRSHVHMTRLPLTPWYRQTWLLWYPDRVDWRVEWCSVVFSD